MISLITKPSLLLLIVLLFVPNNSVQAAYNKDYFGETVIHEAAFEDTLIHLARNNGLGFVELRAANPTLDPWIPGKNAKIILPKRHILPDAPRKGLVINLAEMRVYYFKNKGQEPLTYPISIGREGLQTPVGTTSIVRKKDGPTWRPTARMREEDPTLPQSVPPGPDNPLGTHALYLGWPQYLMHGTNKPYGIGRRVSSGCMRMYPEDIKKLFPLVPVGTPVNVVDQPVKVGWIGEDYYIEVSPSQDQAKAIEEDGVLNTYEITKADIALINRKAGAKKDMIDWEKVRQAVKNHSGYPVAIIGGHTSGFKNQVNPSNEYSLLGNKKEEVADKAEVKEVSAPEMNTEPSTPTSNERVNVYPSGQNTKMKLSNIKLRSAVNE